MSEQVAFQRPASMSDAVTHYCPGCTHGVIHRLVAEVIDAVEQFVLMSDVNTKAKITFNSCAHSSFPMERATVTAVAFDGSAGASYGDNAPSALAGAEETVAQGHVYFSEGKWWTVKETDRNDAVA